MDVKYQLGQLIGPDSFGTTRSCIGVRWFNDWREDEDPTHVIVTREEYTRMRVRIFELERAIKTAISFDTDGHAWWDGEGDPYIAAGGHRRLKQTLEDK